MQNDPSFGNIHTASLVKVLGVSAFHSRSCGAKWFAPVVLIARSRPHEGSKVIGYVSVDPFSLSAHFVGGGT